MDNRPNFQCSDIGSVMASYLQEIEDGGRPDPATYLQRYPQFSDDLKSFFRNHHWLGEPMQPNDQASLVGTIIGPYQIDDEIARGGMGVVYRATQTDLGRSVALKLISSGLLASREERCRFRIEAEAAAQLHHPGIVAIHDIGTWQGYEYFSMALVEGATLQQVVDGPSLDDQQVAELVIEIAQAVAYAHQMGILHRDLKPDNVLIDGQGRPLLTDFGLAKWQRDGTLLTRTGQVLGTPNYMSPEQAAGEDRVTQRSDVYSLGAILYALLTGSPPHEGESAAEVLRSVIQDDPRSPRQLRREASPLLEKICLKALARDPSQRYQQAGDLAADLQRFLDGAPITADQSGLLGQVARELNRDHHQRFFVDWCRTLQQIGVVIFVAHLAITVLNYWQYARWISLMTPRVIMFAVIAAVIYRARSGQLTPRTVAERPVYSIWLGYIAALAVINLLTRLSIIESVAVFPITSTLSGFGFLAMSGHVWGGTAILGIVFLAVALVLPFTGILAPLIFGTWWLASLIILAWHYRVPESNQDS